MKKDIGLIIDFDDVEYSNEERDLLWGAFHYGFSGSRRKPKKGEQKCKMY